MDEYYNIYDGAHVQHNCTNIDRAQYSYNAAVLLQGAAFMYDHVSWARPPQNKWWAHS